MVMIADLK